MPSLFPMPLVPCRSGRNPRGVSLIELIVVLLIMIVVSGFTMGAIQTMRKNTKVGASADRITSLLHLARNLAISNNAMYFVRINAAGGGAGQSDNQTIRQSEGTPVAPLPAAEEHDPNV